MIGLRDIYDVPPSCIAERHWQSGVPRVAFERIPDRGVDVLAMAAEEAQPDERMIADFARKNPSARLVLCPFADIDDDGYVRNVAGQIAERAADEIVGYLNEGKRALVTCIAGLNRSGLVSGLILVKRYGVRGAAAAERVRQQRPRALSNAAFRHYLESIP